MGQNFAIARTGITKPVNSSAGAITARRFAQSMRSDVHPGVLDRMLYLVRSKNPEMMSKDTRGYWMVNSHQMPAFKTALRDDKLLAKAIGDVTRFAAMRKTKEILGFEDARLSVKSVSPRTTRREKVVDKLALTVLNNMDVFATVRRPHSAARLLTEFANNKGIKSAHGRKFNFMNMRNYVSEVHKKAVSLVASGDVPKPRVKLTHKPRVSS